jgi:ABC-type antimicrobial peptide transport system permease subunit
MFTLLYAWNELRRRLGRTLVTALGLAAGVGIVIGVIGVSDGLRQAQDKALSPLSSVGTDLVVTRTVLPTNTAGTSASAPQPQTPGGDLLKQGGSFFGSAGGAFAKLNAQDAADVLSSNSSVITDLSKLGPPGTQFVHDFFLAGTLITFPQQSLSVVSSIKGVESAVPALSLQAQHETGTVPTITATVVTGGQTLNSIQDLPPLTPAQGQAILTCITSDPGALGFFAGGGGATSAQLADTFDPLLEKCLPASYQSFVAQVVVPALTINEVVNPPTTNTATSVYAVAGVDPSHPGSGLVTKAQLVSGTWFGADPAHQVLVSTAYASTKSIKVGQHLTINNTTYTVVGLVNPSVTGDTADVYFDLPTLQSLSSNSGRVNEVLVTVSKGANLNAVAATIRRDLPGAQVLTDAALHDKVSGSLASSEKLVKEFLVPIALIILIATFLIAVLLTLSNVTKRVREIGTLRAIGWSRGRVVRQLLTETTGIGILGAGLGLLVGVGVCAAVGHFAPALTETSSGNTISASAASVFFHASTQSVVSNTVHLTAPISGATILLAVVFSVVGGLVAGAAGGWRASRLAPASALQDLG